MEPMIPTLFVTNQQQRMYFWCACVRRLWNRWLVCNRDCRQNIFSLFLSVFLWYSSSTPVKRRWHPLFIREKNARACVHYPKEMKSLPPNASFIPLPKFELPCVIHIYDLCLAMLSCSMLFSTLRSKYHGNTRKRIYHLKLFTLYECIHFNLLTVYTRYFLILFQNSLSFSFFSL